MGSFSHLCNQCLLDVEKKRTARELTSQPFVTNIIAPADTAAAHHPGVSPVLTENHGHPAYRWGGSPSPTCENRKQKCVRSEIADAMSSMDLAQTEFLVNYSNVV